jgi:putative membrane protein
MTGMTASLVLLAASAAIAQSTTPATASDTDKSFVEAALKGGMGEVDLGKLAVKKGASEDVKAFGQRMIRDHTKLDIAMKSVATEIGVTPPDMRTISDMGEQAKLDLLSGNDFDKAYISAMLKDHEADLADFKKEIADTSSPAVKKAAREGETIITEHLELIRKIAKAHDLPE